MQNQLNMLEGDLGIRAYGAKFKPGDIVRQNWPWIGHFNVAYVYFQVREFQRQDEENDYLCMAIPYGSCMNDVSWIPESYLVPMGRSFLPVRPYDLLKEDGIIGRYYRQHCGDPWEKGWPAAYMASIHSTVRVPAGGASPYHKTGAPWPDQAPFAWEREMVEFLDSLPVKWYEVSRDNWYEKFPEDIKTK